MLKKTLICDFRFKPMVEENNQKASTTKISNAGTKTDLACFFRYCFGVFGASY